MSINSLRRSGSAGSGIKSHWNTFYAPLWREACSYNYLFSLLHLQILMFQQTRCMYAALNVLIRLFLRKHWFLMRIYDPVLNLQPRFFVSNKNADRVAVCLVRRGSGVSGQGRVHLPSRMRTNRQLTVSLCMGEGCVFGRGWCVWSGGGCVWSWGGVSVSGQGVVCLVSRGEWCVWSGGCIYPPPPRGQTDACENITFPRFATQCRSVLIKCL